MDKQSLKKCFSILLILLVATKPLQAVQDPFAFPAEREEAGRVLRLRFVSEHTWAGQRNHFVQKVRGRPNLRIIKFYLDPDVRHSQSKLHDLLGGVSEVLAPLSGVKRLHLSHSDDRSASLFRQIVDHEAETQQRLRSIGQKLFGEHTKARHLWRLLFNTVVAIKRASSFPASHAAEQPVIPSAQRAQGWRHVSTAVRTASAFRSPLSSNPVVDFSAVEPPSARESGASRLRGLLGSAGRAAHSGVPGSASALSVEVPGLPRNESQQSNVSQRSTTSQNIFSGIHPSHRAQHRAEVRRAIKKIREQFPFTDQTSVWSDLLLDADNRAPSMSIDLTVIRKEGWGGWIPWCFRELTIALWVQCFHF